MRLRRGGRSVSRRKEKRRNLAFRERRHQDSRQGIIKKGRGSAVEQKKKERPRERQRELVGGLDSTREGGEPWES